MTVQIVNIDRLMRKLEDLGVNSKQVLRTSMAKNINFVEGQAKMLCSVDTGWLQGSITSDTKENGDKIESICSTSVEYAQYVEFGTGPVGEANHEGICPDVPVTYRQTGWSYINKDGERVYTKGQPAKPFMYPALKDNEKKVIKEIRKDLKKAIREVANG